MYAHAYIDKNSCYTQKAVNEEKAQKHPSSGRPQELRMTFTSIKFFDKGISGSGEVRSKASRLNDRNVEATVT